MALRLLLPLLALAAVLTAVPPAGQAGEINRIVAVVNDDAITVVDLQMRLRLMQVTSNLPDSAEVRQRITPQVLRKMIEERLMMQEAKRLKITVGKDDVAKHVALLEKQNRMEAGGIDRVLKQAGIPLSVFHRQIEADLAWVKVIRMSMSARVKVSEDEVKEHLEMLQGQLGQPEYLLAEILLPLEDGNDAEVLQTAQRITEQMRRGASFQQIARQFSQSASAAGGGDLGWVPVASLEPEAANVLARMAPNSLSPPIRTIDGYQILLLRDRRIFGEKSSMASTGEVSLAQLFVPAGSDRGGATRRLMEMAAGVKNCNDMEALAKRHNLPQSGRGTAKLAQMSEQARKFVGGLKLLQLSQPLQDQQGVRVIMVCGRSSEGAQSESGLPSAEEIRSQLERQRIELLAQRHMRDLKRAAFIEIKQ